MRRGGLDPFGLRVLFVVVQQLIRPKLVHGVDLSKVPALKTLTMNTENRAIPTIDAAPARAWPFSRKAKRGLKKTLHI